jgi:hypothetical protein
MTTNLKKTLLSTIILIAIVGIGTGFVSAAPPTIGDISIDPEQPTAQSTVTFTVDVTADQISGVYTIVQECNGNTGICYTPQNMSMTEITQGTYETSVLLSHEDATYFTYSVNVHSANGWDNTTGIKLNLAVVPDGDKSPGFELILVPFSLAIVGIILFLRKRI